jgi:hypothetical protein
VCASSSRNELSRSETAWRSCAVSAQSVERTTPRAGSVLAGSESAKKETNFQSNHLGDHLLLFDNSKKIPACEHNLSPGSGLILPLWALS